MVKELVPQTDYKKIAEALSRSTAVVAGKEFDEALVPVIQNMTDEEARTYVEALSRLIEIVAWNP